MIKQKYLIQKQLDKAKTMKKMCINTQATENKELNNIVSKIPRCNWSVSIETDVTGIKNIKFNISEYKN